MALSFSLGHGMLRFPVRLLLPKEPQRIPVGISSMESDHLGTENDHFIITISLYTTESLRGPDSKTNSVLASFVREFDVLELGCQII